MAWGAPAAAAAAGVVVFFAAVVHDVAVKDCTNTLPRLTASHTEHAAAQLQTARPEGEAMRTVDLCDTSSCLSGFLLFFAGHYLSAIAKMWASTHNATLHEKMSSVVDVLYDCQKKMGTGVEAIKAVWAPYYTIHKIMQGLLDQYMFAGNSRALDMVVGMANYFSDRETGGMNDLLYKLYTIMNDQKHLTLAHLFDKPCFLGLLAIQADSISCFHSNTHILLVIGALKTDCNRNSPETANCNLFMDTINSSHSYATGGTSASEFWPLDALELLAIMVGEQNMTPSGVAMGQMKEPAVSFLIFLLMQTTEQITQWEQRFRSAARVLFEASMGYSTFKDSGSKLCADCSIEAISSISFIAKGVRRNVLLEPLYSLR
ncbi:hypothetical protein ABZP36_022744 [Zizania latifolia]